MKKVIISFLTVFIFWGITPELSPQRNLNTLNTIILDAGHGGKDPGAIGVNKSYEKDLNLKITFKVKELLENNYRDLNIVLTRSDDTFIELQDRGRIANESGGNLFISIHCNSKKLDDPEEKTGFEMYILDPKRLDRHFDLTLNQNLYLSDIKRSNEDSVINSIKASSFIFSNYKYEERMAKILIKEFVKETGLTNRGIKQEPFVVLYGASMPAVLIECGFLSNQSDEAYLNSEKGQNDVANAIYKAIRFYKTEYDFENNFYR